MNLERRLKELSNNKKRIGFACELVDMLRGSVKGTFSLHYSYAQALDQLLSDTIDRHFTSTPLYGWPKETIVLNCFHHFVIEPQLRIDGKRRYITYPTRFLDKCYTLCSYRLDSDKTVKTGTQKQSENILQAQPKLEVVGIVRDKRIYFGGIHDHSVFSRHYDYDDFFFTSYIRKKLFQSSSGVAIRKTDKKGKITMGGKKILLGHQNGDQYIIVFFQREETYLFNLSGEMVFEVLSQDEIKEKRKILRMLAAQEKMEKQDEFSLKEISDIVFQELKERWQKDPLQFKAWDSISYIIRGSIEATTASDGTVILTNYQNGERRKGIFVSASYAHRKVRLEFKGSYVTVYNNEEIVNGNELVKCDELVNCHEYDEPINYLRCLRSVDILGLDLVYLRTFNSKNWLHTIIGDSDYHFSVKEAKEKYNLPWENVKHVGLAANTMSQYFELLIIDNNDTFAWVPINLHSKRPYQKVGKKKKI